MIKKKKAINYGKISLIFGILSMIIIPSFWIIAIVILIISQNPLIQYINETLAIIAIPLAFIFALIGILFSVIQNKKGKNKQSRLGFYLGVIVILYILLSSIIIQMIGKIYRMY